MSAAESMRAYSRSSCTRLDLYVPLYALPDTTAGWRYGDSETPGICKPSLWLRLGMV